MKKLKTLMAVAVAICMISACIPAVASPGVAKAKQIQLTTAVTAVEVPATYDFNSCADLQIYAGVFVHSDMEDFYKVPEWRLAVDYLDKIKTLSQALHKNAMYLNMSDRRTKFERVDLSAFLIPVEEPISLNYEDMAKQNADFIKRAFGLPADFDLSEHRVSANSVDQI